MKTIYYCLLLLPIFFGCEKFMFEENLASTAPRDNFEYLWKECHDKYSYFELKNIDWDEVYVRYSAKVTDDMSDDSLFHLMASMLLELKDGHTNLISSLNVSFFSIENFDWRILEDNYLSDNYYVSGPFVHDFIANNQVGYIRFPSYTGGVTSTNFNFILNRYKDTQGLILDIRENGGGTVTDIFNILSHFVSDTTLVYYSRIKSGSGNNDFSDDEPAYVYPADTMIYAKKVMVLIDRGSYSAASFTSLAIKAIPNMVLIGDTTGGGLGLPNGGQLPNGWTYRFSITQALTLDKDNSYENGVPPDITVLFDWNNRSKDEVIDRAVEEILLSK